MMRTVKLWGGPMHGLLRAIEEDADHFHIVETAANPLINAVLDIPMQTREGTYVMVSYSRGDFEWNGWQVHD